MSGDVLAEALARIEQIAYQPWVPSPDPGCGGMFTAVRLVDVYAALAPGVAATTPKPAGSVGDESTEGQANG